MDNLLQWKFIDKDLLRNILYVREGLNKPITINTWHNNGIWEQRGLRENISKIVKRNTAANRLYLSAHTLGKAVDFDVDGMTAAEVREWISNSDIPIACRLEKNVSWVHLDIVAATNQLVQVYQFNA